MEKITTDTNTAVYAELRVQNDLLVAIANSLMNIEAHLCAVPKRAVDTVSIAEKRISIISPEPPA